jgi:hypothetical protein
MSDYQPLRRYEHCNVGTLTKQNTSVHTFYHTAFLTSELDVCDWPASRLDRFTPGERLPTPIEQESVWVPGQV